MTVLRVVSAAIDKKQAVLYLEDGNKHIIKQGDYRLNEVFESIMKINNQGKVAVVDLEAFSAYAHFEEKTNGFIKFFRVAKEKVKHLFSFDSEPEEEEVPVTIPEATMVTDPVAKAPEPVAAVRPTTDEVLKDAHPVMSDELGKDETIVAKVGDKLIPNAEMLKNHITNVVKTKNTVGLQRFIERMGAMQDTPRGHSVNDLLRFIEDADLPLADDGSIIAYKLLNSASGQNPKRNSEYPSYFFDCHSGNVPQRVGTEVRVAEDLVDKNRSNECSNGLHIARRAYLKSFGGDVCVLVKINPEDVITVPHGDANKVRVCAYHILGRLPDLAKSRVMRNQPMTDIPEAAELLALAISGKHIPIWERTTVLSQKGREVKVETVTKRKNSQVGVELDDSEKNKAVALDDKRNNATVDPKELNRKIAEHDAELEAQAVKAAETALKPETVDVAYLGKEPESEVNPDAGVTGTLTGEGTKNEKPLTNAQLARSAYEFMVSPVSTKSEKTEGYNKLMEIKKRSKLSYVKLGFNSDEVIVIANAADGSFPSEIRNAVASHVTPDKDDPIVARNAKEAASKTGTPHAEGLKPSKVQKDVAAKPKVSKPAKDNAPATSEPVQKELFNQNKWSELWDLKRKRKVSWEKLGFNGKEISLIEANKP